MLFMKFIHKSFPARSHDPLNLNLPPLTPPAAEEVYDDPADSLQVVAVWIFKYKYMTVFKLKIAISTLMPALLEQDQLDRAKEMYSERLDFFFE